jgi:hypothetical protein
MSNVKNKTDISGLLGETVKVRKVRGQVVVTNRPKRRMGKPSDKQAEVQAKFLEAAQYASRQIAQKESNALYAEGMTARKPLAYVVAMSDYLVAPTVHHIDTLGYRGAIGDRITVKATDDFMVTSVKVVITDPSGKVIEQGDAGPNAERINLWAYTATVANPSPGGTKVSATAFDRPGNSTQAEVVI